MYFNMDEAEQKGLENSRCQRRGSCSRMSHSCLLTEGGGDNSTR